MEIGPEPAFITYAGRNIETAARPAGVLARPHLPGAHTGRASGFLHRSCKDNDRHNRRIRRCAHLRGHNAQSVEHILRSYDSTVQI